MSAATLTTNPAPTATWPRPALTAPVPARLPAPPAHLRRLRWGIRATLTLGVSASVAANILHAHPNPISQIIAAWPPLALLLTVELISRVPTHRRSLAVIRLVATAAIAGIAAWVSYWHMVGVAARYGETEAAASYLLPLSVDGLVIVASVSLVEITGRIRDDLSQPVAALTPAHATQPAPTTPPPDEQQGMGLSQCASPVSERPNAQTAADGLASRPAAHAEAVDTLRQPVPASPAQADAVPGAWSRPPSDGAGTLAPAALSRFTPTHTDDAANDTAKETGSAHLRPPNPCADEETGPNAANIGATAPTDGQIRPPRGKGDPSAPEADTSSDDDGDELVPSDTAAAVAYWYRRDRELHPAEIAARIGRSPRTVRRYWPPTTTTGEPGTNGHTADESADSLKSS